MASVAVSSARFNSLLANRRRTVDDIAAALPTSTDLHALVEQDLVLDLSVVEALARFFGRPWPYLLIDKPEDPPAVGRDHRRRGRPGDELSEEMLAALRASQEQLDAIIDLFPDDLMVVLDHDLTGGTAEDAGAALRAFLAVSVEDQLHPKDEFAALRTWIDALDHAGIYVAQRKLNDSSVRAFSLFGDGHALAVVDTGDSGWARCFSLLHEVVHLQMRSAGICDLDERSSVERWCNAVAAAALMPSVLLARVDLPALRSQPGIADDALRAGAKLLGVSQLALLIRCRDLGLLSNEIAVGLEERWAQRRAAESPSRGGDYYYNAINRVGRRFTRQVLHALDDAAITRQEAAVVLDVREHQVDPLRQRV